MKYFAVFLMMKDEELSRVHRPEHLEFLSRQREAGTVLMNGRFTDGAGGLIIYRAEDEASAVSLIRIPIFRLVPEILKSMNGIWNRITSFKSSE